MEQLGVPATAIITTPFSATAKMTAESWAMPDYPFVTVPHPISNNDEERLRAKAGEALSQTLAVLVQDEADRSTEHAAESSSTFQYQTELQSVEVEGVNEAIELFFERGWTDGLPVVPPTPHRVQAFIEASGLGPQHVIAEEPVRRRRLTVDRVAVNAVMAGCEPEYMPVIVAIIKAMCDPSFNLHGSSASTGGSAVFITVNGPIRMELGMNATHNVFANGNRVNATIGRAIRLIIVNMLSGIPGGFDRSTLGHPGKFSFCIAEDEEGSPWLPLSVEQGIDSGESSVTVMACESPHQIMNEWTQRPKDILDTFVAAIRGNMLTYSIWSGNYAIVIPKQMRDIIASAGWQKKDIREYIYEQAIVVRHEWREVGKSSVVRPENEGKVYRALSSPNDLLVIAAGGPVGGFGAIIPPWFGKNSRAVTTVIEKP